MAYDDTSRVLGRGCEVYERARHRCAILERLRKCGRQRTGARRSRANDPSVRIHERSADTRC